MGATSTTARNPADGRRIRVGPAGWSYRDWDGIVYPRGAGRGFDRLRWIARLFDFIEVNVSFYRVPSPRTSASWVERLEGFDLRFSAKAPSALTHSRDATDAVCADFERFLRPLAEAQRLQCVLAQFPWSFRPGDASLSWMHEIQERMDPIPVVHELRHGDWNRPDWRAALGEFSLVTVDQPRVGNSLPPLVPDQGDVYLRLHGRNEATWFAADAGRDARYDYLYSEGEIDEWVRRVTALVDEGRPVTIVTNNHFEGQAIVNALEIDAVLGRPTERVPEGLLHHPGLQERFERRGFRPRFVADLMDDGSTRRSAQADLF